MKSSVCLSSLLCLLATVAWGDQPPPAQFTFDGRQYRVAKAAITANIGDPYWCDLYNDGKGKSITWTISFTAESDAANKLPRRFVDFEGFPIPVKNWHDLSGYKTAWDEPHDPKTGERYGLIDNQLISAGRVQIASRNGTEFRIVASGKNEDGKAFSIDAPAVFKGIYVRGSEKDSDETIQARLKEQIDDANLLGTPFKLDFKYGSGVKAGKSFFSPKRSDR